MTSGFAYLSAYTRVKPHPSEVWFTLVRPPTLKRLLAVLEY